jgi:ribosomal protein S27AE
MNNGTCPRCGSAEIIASLRVQGGDSRPVYVDIVEPDPPNRPFIWMPQNARSQFLADICGACGYTEFQAENFKGLNEISKKFPPRR